MSKMSKQIITASLAVVCLALLTAAAQADVLAYYDNDAGGTQSDWMKVETVDPGVTAGDLSLNGLNFSTGSNTIWQRPSDLDASTSDNDYTEFTISAVSGTIAQIDSITFGHYYTGSGTLPTIYWDVQVDTGSGFVDVGSAQDATSTAVPSPEEPEFATVSLGLTDVSSATFRVYVYDDDGAGENNSNIFTRTKTFQVDGQVVPEPTSMALLGVGGLMIAGGRRKRG